MSAPLEHLRGGQPLLSVGELTAFLHLAETLNFRRAAEQSFISQPALSRRIQSAEAKLNTRLLDRNTRQVALTPAGEELVPIARRILFEFHDSLSELSEFIGGHRGTVVIGCLPSFAAAVLPPAMAEFRKTHPQVRIILRPVNAQSILAMVREGEANFGISIPPPPSGEFRFQSYLADDEVILICARSDPLADEGQADWSVFLERPYITSGDDSSITPVVEAGFRRHLPGSRIQPEFEVANISVLGKVVAQGLGIAAVPRLSLHLIDTTGLRVLPLKGAPVMREIGIIQLQRRSASMAARLFLETLSSLRGQISNGDEHGRRSLRSSPTISTARATR